MMGFKKIQCFLLIILFFSSCSEVKPDVESLKTNINSDNLAPYNEILNEYDKIFEQEYSKFTLPNKDRVNISIPEGIYTLTVGYKNSNKDVKWAENLFKNLVNKFYHDKNPIVENKDNIIFSYGNIASIGLFGDIGMLEKDFNITKYMPSDNFEAEVESYWLNRMSNISNTNNDNMDFSLSEAVDLCDTFFNKDYKNCFSDFTLKPKDVNLLKYDNEEYAYYMICESVYKGVPLQENYDNFTFSEDVYGTVSLQTHVLLQNHNVKFVSSPERFTVIKEQPVDKILSLQGAVNQLEEQLANNYRLNFDGIELMYEAYDETPRISLVNEDSDFEKDLYNLENGKRNFTYTPVWCFMIDSDTDNFGNKQFYHYREYITVNAITGEISVHK